VWESIAVSVEPVRGEGLSPDSAGDDHKPILQGKIPHTNSSSYNRNKKIQVSLLRYTTSPYPRGIMYCLKKLMC